MNPFIVRYKPRDVAPGRPFGDLHLSDRRSIVAVWSEELHKQCIELAKYPALPLIVQTRTSSKSGNVYLTSIEAEGGQAAIYEAARLRDEAKGRTKANSFTGQQIAKGVQRRVEEDAQKGAA